MSDTRNLAELESELGYRFTSQELLVRALTHRSASRTHNERLEFLGDAVLGYVVAEYLHRTRQALGEDSLTIMRASLVKRASLAGVAGQIGLGEYLVLDTSAERTGGRQRPSLLADTLEAVLGAVHEDGGIDAARALVMRLFGERFDGLAERVQKDAKTDLQERLQAQGHQLPEYRIVGTAGRPHELVFHIACELAGLGITATATGRSRKKAEKRAAARAIAEIDGLTSDE